MPYISVVIVNYNAGKHLIHCLESLNAQTFKDYEVILVDNASRDGSLEQLPDNLRKNIKIVRNNRNMGFAAANNIGARHASGTWLATLNPDAFPTKNWLLALAESTKRYPEAVMFGSTQVSASNEELLDGTGDIYHLLGIPSRGNFHKPLSKLPETGEVFAPCAAAALYRRDIFLNNGGFDEHFFCYCEDIDLAFRLRLQGEYCIQIREAVVYHFGSAITSQKNGFSTYYGMRNRLWLFIKNMPLALLLVLLPIHLLLQLLFLLKAVLQRQGKPALKGLKDAFLHIMPILKERWKIQKKRKISLFAVIESCTLSPLKLMLRQHDVRPLAF